MAKITSQTKAKELVSLRKRKVQEAASTLKHAVINSRGKLNYALHFWLGAEGVAWFMSKNTVDPEILQSEFEELGVEAFVESERTHELAELVKQAELRFLAEIDAILEQAAV